jgi:hypothetical protein
MSVIPGARDESGAETFQLFRIKQKRNENMKTETEIRKTETEFFFGESENRNGTTFSGGTDAETEVSVSG